MRKQFAAAFAHARDLRNKPAGVPVEVMFPDLPRAVCEAAYSASLKTPEGPHSIARWANVDAETRDYHRARLLGRQPTQAKPIPGPRPA